MQGVLLVEAVVNYETLALCFLYYVCSQTISKSSTAYFPEFVLFETFVKVYAFGSYIPCVDFELFVVYLSVSFLGDSCWCVSVGGKYNGWDPVFFGHEATNPDKA